MRNVALCSECPKPVGKHGGKGLCSKHLKALYRSQGKTQEYNKAYLYTWIRSSEGRYSALKRAAKDKALGFDITIEQHSLLLQELCFYCKQSLQETGHGLDRKDNSQGYVLSNVVPCCVTCNRIKNKHLTHMEMVVAMNAVLKLRSALSAEFLLQRGFCCGSGCLNCPYGIDIQNAASKKRPGKLTPAL